MQNLNLLSNEVTDVNSLFSVVDFKFFVFIDGLVHQFFLVIFKKQINFFKNLLFIFHQLIMYTFF
jgi:hypothetical protein